MMVAGARPGGTVPEIMVVAPPPMRASIEEAIRSVEPAMRGRIAGVGLAVPDEALVGPGIRKALGRDLAKAQAIALRCETTIPA